MLHPAAVQDDYHVIFVFETCQPDVNGMLQVLIMKEGFFLKCSIWQQENATERNIFYKCICFDDGYINGFIQN